MLADSDPAASKVVLIGESDNVPPALLDAANNIVALSARTLSLSQTQSDEQSIAAMDMFVVPTISFRLLHGLLIMGRGRRTECCC